MDSTTKACLDEMKANANLIGERIQDLIDAATKLGMSNSNTAASNSGSNTGGSTSDTSEINAALEPVAQALRMLAHPSSNTSAT